jgi:hypothetical protein
MPHVVMVVQVVDRPFEPKAQLRPLVLELVGIGRPYGVAQTAGGKTDTDFQGVDEAQGQQPNGAYDVIEKFTQPTLAPAVAVMFSVLLAQQPGVHEAVAPVLHQSADEESDAKGAQPFQHDAAP